MALTERVVVYTCITGGYDELLAPQVIEPDIDYVCFSDRLDIEPRGWSLRAMPRDLGDPALDNRYVKMHPHVLFSEHQLSVYVDGYIQPVDKIADFARRTAATGDIALFEHPFRHSIFEEAAVCSAIGHEWHHRIARQMQRYVREGYPPDRGLFEGGIIVRRHHAMQSIELMSAWWDAYCGGVRRDQLSLPYVAWRTGIRPVNLGASDARGEQKHFRLLGIHKKKIHWLIRTRGWLNRRTLALFPKSFAPWD